jgi:hypothetical protein
MAHQMHLNRRTVCLWRRRWLALTPKLAQGDAEGLRDTALLRRSTEGLIAQLPPGASATLTAAQIMQMVAVACEPPEAEV